MKELADTQNFAVSRAECQAPDLVGDFLNRYRESSFRIAMRIVGNAETAEDVAQEALIRAFRCWDRFSAVERQAAWVRRIVVRCALNSLERLPDHSAIPEEASDANSTEGDTMVRAVLDSLMPEQRALLALSMGEGLSYAEISELLEIPIGTVGSRIHAAKAAFRRAWGEA